MMSSIHPSLADIVLTRTSIALLCVLVSLWPEIQIRHRWPPILNYPQYNVESHWQISAAAGSTLIH